MCFLLLYNALEIVPDVEIFHYFYCITSINDWVTFSSRQGATNICIVLSDSIKLWKNKLFFVDSLSLPFPMTYSKTSCHPCDPKPCLSPKNEIVYQVLSNHVIKWSDPKEVILGMARLSLYWDRRGWRHFLILEGPKVLLISILTL